MAILIANEKCVDGQNMKTWKLWGRHLKFSNVFSGKRSLVRFTCCLAILSLLLVGSTLRVIQSLTTSWPQLQWFQMDQNFVTKLESNKLSHGNYTEHILEQLQQNASNLPCYEVHTSETRIFGLPIASSTDDVITLTTGVEHHLLLVSYSPDGSPRCAGGDFYETDLASNQWHARPPIEDLDNGSYAISLMVDDMFAGSFNFSIFLLFDAFHGLDHVGVNWMLGQQMVSFEIVFVKKNEIQKTMDYESLLSQNGILSHNLKQCDKNQDFTRNKWTGKWVRTWINDSCEADAQGRFKDCVSIELANDHCIHEYCSGRVSRLESNGWVYSAHCAPKIFEAEEAWNCLDGKWLLFWGDSNFQDTIRNLMFFILEMPVPEYNALAHWQLPRSFEQYMVNPLRPDQAVHMSSIFNGHHDASGANEGLDSLKDPKYCEWIQQHFQNQSNSSPDIIFMNSGLHDGFRFRSPSDYVQAVDMSLDFWESIWNSTSKKPTIVYRTTVAPAGLSRGMISNPHKMEVFNKIMVERLTTRVPNVRVVDAYDLTFPWHYDNNYSDGGHYGRAPGTEEFWHGKPHHYFVDVMLAHLLLNAICPP